MDFVQHIAEQLVRRERRHGLKIRAMLVFGGPLSFLGPLAVATMFWIALKYGFRSSGFAEGVTWLDLFVGLSVIMIPLLYGMEMRTQGGFRTDLSDVIPVPGVALVMGSRGAVPILMLNARATSSVFVEFFLLGPRLVLSGLRQRGLSRSVRLGDRQEAAAILERLSNRDDGIQTNGLLSESESVEKLLPTLAYLAYHQWIGVGETWQRLWLLTASRQVLATTQLGSP